jgi:hypothetical protein
MIQLMRPSPTPPQDIGVSFTQSRWNGKRIWILLPNFVGCSFVKPINRSIFDESLRYCIHCGRCGGMLGKGRVAGDCNRCKSTSLVIDSETQILSPSISSVGWNDLKH